MTTELHELEVDGRTVRYRVTGSGEPLVLVHGLGGSWRWWSPVLELLAGRRRVYVVDLPRLRDPVGAPQLSEWLARWLDAMALERFEPEWHSPSRLGAAGLAAR